MSSVTTGIAPTGDCAVVLGAGMAGLLAARVLSDFYREVVIVERDRLDGGAEPRRGVPHGRHAHALLARGQEIVDELFPGLTNGLIAAGVPAGDVAGRLRWYFNGRRLQPGNAGLLSVSATRPVLEHTIRERVRAISRVRMFTRTDIIAVTTDETRRRVTGVRIARHDAAGEEELAADLVVDATGRGSRTPVWLDQLGYRRPAEERVQVGLAYTTRHFRLRLVNN